MTQKKETQKKDIILSGLFETPRKVIKTFSVDPEVIDKLNDFKKNNNVQFSISAQVNNGLWGLLDYLIKNKDTANMNI